ncbi:arginine--tRNA ligase [Candidatus Dojkabacteria bacterium]|nr:arginine--tRNA ligase [Candidatus Dojkabacteria bacterium]
MITDTLKSKIQEVVKSLFKVDTEIVVDIPNDSSKGDYFSNVAMQLAGRLKKNPVEIAQEIVKTLNVSDIAEATVASPGYINFKLLTSVYQTKFCEMVDAANKGKPLATNSLWNGKKVMIEFAHPNPFKSFHIGHLRNICLGESLVRLFEASGAKVIRTNYQGDVGLHIAKCLWAFLKTDPKDYPMAPREKATFLGKLYAQGATAYKDNESAKSEIREINKQIYSGENPKITKLWQLGKTWSLEHFHEIYKRVYSRFDREYMETEVMNDGLMYSKQALEKGILKESDGAVIFDGKPHGLDTRVFINNEGLPTYEGKELGLAYKEFTDFGELDLCIHNVAVEQISFFKVTFKVQELLNPKLFKGKQYHNAYEFVGLKKGKMSSREGKVVLAMDILDEAVSRINALPTETAKDNSAEDSDNTEISETVGVGAVKYSFLKVSPFKYMAFDMDECVSLEGNSGPYLQYSYVRARAVGSRDMSVTCPADRDMSVTCPTDGEMSQTCPACSTKEEQELIKSITKFSGVVEDATKAYSPNYLADYLYKLAQSFSRFYENVPVLKEPDTQKKAARLTLVSMFARVMKEGLYLLGIEIVEKM